MSNDTLHSFQLVHSPNKPFAHGPDDGHMAGNYGRAAANLISLA